MSAQTTSCPDNVSAHVSKVILHTASTNIIITLSWVRISVILLAYYKTCVLLFTEPDAQLNPKKKVFEQVQVDLSTGDTLVAQYKGSNLRTDLGEITVKTLASCSIK